MQWPRGEQVVLILGIAAAVVGGAILLAVRRAPSPVRLIEPPGASEIVIQVDGAVLRPGLYHLPVGARAADALRAAGGLLPTADTEVLNGARVLRDGERLHVAPREPAHTTGNSRAVNINTAAAADLETLPGIGPVLAGRIVAYRTRHGPFRRPEDLLQVPGIGPGLLRRLREVVRFE